MKRLSCGVLGVDAGGNTLPTEEAAELDFGRFQRLTELWWQFHLNDRADKGRQLKRELEKAPWVRFEHAVIF